MGWVYVLINPSMSGIYKVGMTERTPDDRAKELSASTSVATPFIVIYRHQTYHPKELEYAVHKELEAYDSRVNHNREFFNGDPSVAIRAIIRLANELSLSDISVPQKNQSNAWGTFEKDAFEYLYGEGDKLKDSLKAIELFKKAEKLGSRKASIELIKLKDGGSKKSNKSLKILSALREEGEIEASYLLLKHYSHQEEIENYIKLSKEIISKGKLIDVPILEETVFELAKIAIYRCSEYGYDVEYIEEISRQESESIIRFLENFQDELLSYFSKKLKAMEGCDTSKFRDMAVTEVGIIATLGRLYSNAELKSAGCNLSIDEIKEIQEDEYCDRADEVCINLSKQVNKNVPMDVFWIIPDNYKKYKEVNEGIIYLITYDDGRKVFLKHSYLDRSLGRKPAFELYFLEDDFDSFVFRMTFRYVGEKFLKINNALFTNLDKNGLNWHFEDQESSRLGPTRNFMNDMCYETYDYEVDNEFRNGLKDLLRSAEVTIHLQGEEGEKQILIEDKEAASLYEMIVLYEEISKYSSVRKKK